MNSNVMVKAINCLDGLSECIGRTISWLTLAMVIVTFIVVVMRYVFEVGNIQLQESVIYMHSFVFLLAAGYTLKHDGHVRVDIFTGRWGTRQSHYQHHRYPVSVIPGCRVYSVDLLGLCRLLLEKSGRFTGSRGYRSTLYSQNLSGCNAHTDAPAGLAELMRNLLVLTGDGHLLKMMIWSTRYDH
ncbi:TRAP transporter small permease subunit [Aliamphritea spongicola]|nr:TRAP transporter small permease subunit [Aliamphritea spongicola]